MLAIRTILHPTDFSPCAARAFRLACDLAHDYGARLVVLHVGRPPEAPAGEAALPAGFGHYRMKLAERLSGLQPADPDLCLEHRLVLGEDAAAEIVRAAREADADLIILGTHGRTGMARVLLGSVSEQVMRSAPCPVLTLRIPLSAAARPGVGRQAARTG
jgi:nucleotide-binding universal stress UspA family protein